MPSMQINNAKRRECMNLFGLMETSGSAMQAERMRAEVVAANMANAETTRTESGGPYRRHHVVFAANEGAQFAESLAGAPGISTGMAELPSIGAGAGQATGGVHIAQVVE